MYLSHKVEQLRKYIDYRKSCPGTSSYGKHQCKECGQLLDFRPKHNTNNNTLLSNSFPRYNKCVQVCFTCVSIIDRIAGGRTSRTSPSGPNCSTPAKSTSVPMEQSIINRKNSITHMGCCGFGYRLSILQVPRKCCLHWRNSTTRATMRLVGVRSKT